MPNLCYNIVEEMEGRDTWVENTINRFLVRLKDDGYAHNTISAYGSDIRQFCAFVRKVDASLAHWQEITYAHQAVYWTHLERLDRSPSSIKRKCVVVAKFFAFCGVKSPVCSGVQIVNQPVVAPSARPLLLSPPEIVRLLGQPARTLCRTTARDRALLELLCEAGLQPSDLAGLDVGDVEAGAHAIVCGAASNHPRRVVLGLRATAALSDYLLSGRAGLRKDGEATNRDDQPLFLNQRGKRLTRQGIWLIVRTHAAAAGIGRPVTPRILRHLSQTKWAETPIYEDTASFLLLDGIAVLPEQPNPPNQPANQ